jgi:hypothetical protein
VLVQQGAPVTDFFVLRTGLCTISKKIDLARLAGKAPDCGDPVRSRDYTSLLEDAMASADHKHALRRPGTEWRSFDLGKITGGQVAGEFAVLESGQNVPSPVSVIADTAVAALVIAKEDLAAMLGDFYGDSMARVRKNLCTALMTEKQVAALYQELCDWERLKTEIVSGAVHITNRMRAVLRDAEQNHDGHDANV